MFDCFTILNFPFSELLHHLNFVFDCSLTEGGVREGMKGPNPHPEPKPLPGSPPHPEGSGNSHPELGLDPPKYPYAVEAGLRGPSDWVLRHV